MLEARAKNGPGFFPVRL